jgi:hypothetical protein
MPMLVPFLLILALVLFIIAAAFNPPPWWNRLIAAGLASAILAFLLTHWPK